jgi:hypothetical protein
MTDEVVRLVWAVAVGVAGHWTVNFTVQRYRHGAGIDAKVDRIEVLEKELKMDHEKTRDLVRTFFAEAREVEHHGREAAVARLALALDNLGSKITIEILEMENRRHER